MNSAEQAVGMVMMQLVVLVGIALATYHLTMYGVTDDCKDFGKFKTMGVIYDCSPEVIDE